MKKKYNKAYVEITNVCNLTCDFCPQNQRKPEIMDTIRFNHIIGEVEKQTDYVYFHVLGEPTLNGNLVEFCKIANEKNLKITITTNGTNTEVLEKILKQDRLYKINISLQALGGNENLLVESHMKKIVELCNLASSKGTLVVLRLWNSHSEKNRQERNDLILKILESHFGQFDFNENGSVTLKKKVFLEGADEFCWKVQDEKENVFCYGLKDQFAILVDGTVIPCCIDSLGEICLGNVLEKPLDEILSDNRARNICEGFKNKKAVEPRCKVCGYARRFKV